MTKLLIRLFVKDSKNTENPTVRARYGRLAGLVGLVCNALLAAGKLLAGALSGSIAIMADAVNNLSDAASSIITLVGFKLGAKPADKEHPFGHARFEYIAGLGVAVLVLVVGLELGKSSIEKIISPTPVAYGWVSLAVLAISILIKLWMALFNRHVGDIIESATLKATFVDSRNDVITTTVVLTAALIARFTGLALDGWMGAGVAIFIIVSGVGLVRETLDPLLGTAPDPELVQYVVRKISAYPGVLGTHDLIVHDYGPGRRFASAHVEMDAGADVLESHDVIDNIERSFLAEDNIHLIIHYDPIQTGGEAACTARGRVVQAVAGVDERLSIHDFKLIDGPTHQSYVFDVVLPPDYTGNRQALHKTIEAALQQPEGLPVRAIITFDDSYDAIPE